MLPFCKNRHCLLRINIVFNGSENLFPLFSLVGNSLTVSMPNGGTIICFQNVISEKGTYCLLQKWYNVEPAIKKAKTY